MLGGDAALRRLLDEAHARGMRVVLDGVFNHASRGFFQFHDILENGVELGLSRLVPRQGASRSTPTTPTAHPNYGAWWGLPALPKFNTDTPAVREFLLGVARHWIDFGIDGWRLDVANEIDDDDFWREFRHRVRAGNPEAYIVGEVWHDARRWLQGDMWDAVMNYLFTHACISFFIGRGRGRGRAEPDLPLPGRAARGAGVRREDRRPCWGSITPNVTAVMLNLLDSHDMAAVPHPGAGRPVGAAAGHAVPDDLPRRPSIYYGDEIGLPGGHDPFNRGAFPWDSSALGHDLLHEFQRLIALRKARPALRRGTFDVLLADGEVHVHLGSSATSRSSSP